MTQDTKALIERKPVTKHMVINLHHEHPDWTAPMMAKYLGCTPAYIHATAKRNGLTLEKSGMGNLKYIADLKKRIAELEGALNEIITAADFYSQPGTDGMASRYAHESHARLARTALTGGE